MSNTNLTRGGVSHDFDTSPFSLEIFYNSIEHLTFVFSSQLYKDKFKEQLEENRKNINESLSKRFGFNIEHNKLCDIKLYIKIEKRGFLIKNYEKSFKCLNSIKLDGIKLTTRN